MLCDVQFAPLSVDFNISVSVIAKIVVAVVALTSIIFLEVTPAPTVAHVQVVDPLVVLTILPESPTATIMSAVAEVIALNGVVTVVVISKSDLYTLPFSIAAHT